VNDAAQVALTILSSGVVAAGVSGILNMRADARRERRDDDALRRHVRAAAHALATRVVMARQFGFTNVSSLTSSLAYLEEISKDRAIEKALSDKGSRALHESVDLLPDVHRILARPRHRPRELPIRVVPGRARKEAKSILSRC
jgi:hypothetical protein